MKKQLFSLLSFLMICIGIQAQTTLISPAGDGGFENGGTFASNGWTVVNGPTNTWNAGSATFASGVNSAYISASAGSAYTYSNTVPAVAHFYRDVTFPAGESVISFSFKLKGDGDFFSPTYYDKLMVYLAPTTFTPTTANPASPGNALTGATLVYSQAGNYGAGYVTISGTLPASYAGTTTRLIFSWHNDNTAGTIPASVDDISLVTRAPGNFISIVTGNWTNPATWDANAVPTAADNVTVTATHTVTIDAAAQAANNLDVNGTLSYATTPTAFNVAGNLLVGATGVLNAFNGTTGKTLNISGNFTNNGTVDLSKTGTLLSVIGSAPQTFDGTGTLVTSVIGGLTFNNSSTTPLINWNWSNISVAGSLTFTKGWVNLGAANKLTLGTAIAATTLNYTAGGFLNGTFSRWWSNAGTGTAIAAGADPTTTTSRYPFINAAGLSRSAWIQRSGPTVGGQYSVKYVDASTTSPVAVSDGTYAVQTRYDGNWTFGTEGTSPVATSYTIALVAPGSYPAMNGNNRIIGASGLLGGSHRNGTNTPGAQRTALTLAELTSGPAYIGANNADILSPCSGAPTAGTAVASASAICSATNFSLTLTGSTSGVTGITYQWQSSPNGTTWTNIAAATSTLAVVSQTSMTYYQAIVTCTASAQTATSNVIQVNQSPFMNCYCTTSPSTGGTTDIITQVSVTNTLGQNLTQASTYTAPSYFVSYTNTPLDLIQGSTSNTISITYGADGTQYGAAWIDFNMNGVYEASENIALSSSSVGGGVTSNFMFTVPASASLGTTRMRVRGGSDGAYTAGGACTTSAYGETEDYLVNIVVPPTCFVPTNLIVSNITTTSADIAWVAPVSGTPVQYIGEIRTSGAAGSGTLGLVTTGTLTAPTTTANITGLTALTAYTLYVRSDCGAGDMSPWASTTFTTLANCPVPTALSASPVLATSANFTWTAGGTETAWDIYYGAQPLTVPTATTAPTATSSVASYSATGLTQMTPYSVYVRANCGGGNTSIWTAVSNFTTPASCPVPSLPLISAITPTTAVATWTAGTTETSWLVKYSAPTTTVLAGPMPSYTMTGLAPSSVYTVQVKGICAAGDSSVWTAPVITFTTPCLPPDILTTTPATRCGVGSVMLGATTDVGATLNWYANSTGGSSIGTGTVFTTPTLTTTTDFYVSSTGAIVPGSGGRTAPTATANTTASSYGLVFDAAKNFTLNSVDVYPTGSAGNLVVNLTNNTGAVLQTATIAIPTGTVGTPFTVSLNFPVAAGTGYRLIAVSSPNMIRESALGGFPYSLGQVGNITSGYIGGTSATYYFFYKWQFSYGCESARTAVTASVIAAPVLTLNSPAAICAGSEVGTFSVTSNTSDFDTYIWNPTAGIYTDAAGTMAYTGTSATDVYVRTNTSGVLTINANATNSVTGCAAVASATIMIKNAPTSMTVSATPTVLCAGGTTSLSAAANPVQAVLLNEGFNAGTNNWMTMNASSGGTPTAADWTLRPSGYVPGGSFSGTLTSNDNSQFYFTNSDAQGSGAKTRTILQSPAMNTMNFATLNLNFYHFYTYYSSGDSAVMVQVSTNGTTWTTVKDYKTAAVNVGTINNFAAGTVNLDAYVNNPTLYVRFNYNATWGYGWAIDNVMISGTSTNDYSYSWTSSPAGFTSTASTATDMPTGTTDYSVVITNTTTSCSNSAVVTVSVNPNPTVMAMSSNTAVCAGSSATLTAMGATNYTWSSGGTASTEVVTPTGNTTYTLTGEDNGCFGVATVSVDVNQLPTVSAMASQTLLCDDGSTGSSILTASSTATSFMWSDGAMTMTTSVTPTVTTVYTVTATEMGCSADAFVTVTVSNCNGIKETVANGISIYPNPTNGVLNISISSELAGNTSVEVYDAIGKLVIKDTLSNDANTINLSKLEDGIYVFKIINNNKAIKVGKVVKQ